MDKDITPFPTDLLGNLIDQLLRANPSLMDAYRDEIKANHDKHMYGMAEAQRQMVESDTEYHLRCVLGEKVFYSEDDRARMPGHICSPAGKHEFLDLSHLCEYHSDEYTKEPDGV